MAEGMYAQAMLFAGDPAGCVELLVRAGGGPELPCFDKVSRPSWYHLLAAAEAAAGRPEDAAQWADRAEVVAATLGLAVRTGFAHAARCHALLAVDPASALRWAESAGDLFDGAGIRVEAARARLLAGMALGAIGEPNRAREQFARARTVFEQCGAQLFLEQATREERRMNARMPRRSPRGASGPKGTAAGPAKQFDLTQREVEVATLVAQGLTNRQIAEKLFLSPKTVELHLTRVFAKLGVSSRAAVAGMWADQA
jgi:DNA-binding CsgD family transcriptional regulator